MADRQCPKCSATLTGTARFCARCGAAIEPDVVSSTRELSPGAQPIRVHGAPNQPVRIHSDPAQEHALQKLQKGSPLGCGLVAMLALAATVYGVIRMFGRGWTVAAILLCILAAMLVFLLLGWWFELREYRRAKALLRNKQAGGDR